MTDSTQTKTVRLFAVWNGLGEDAHVGPCLFKSEADAQAFIASMPPYYRRDGLEADAQAWEREAHTVVPVDVPMPQEGVGK